MQHLVVLALLVAFGRAATYDYYPSTPNVPTTLRDQTLNPGDVVNFHAATDGGSTTYDFGTVGSTFTWTGTQTNPIVVRAYPGDTIKITGSNENYDILRLAGSYYSFEGFEIVGNASAQGSLALRLMAGSNHIVLQNLKVHDLYQNAITANSPGATYNNITFRNIEIWNTAGTGECIYAGCQATNSTYTDCVIHDSLFENNYCHDTCLGGGSTTCTGGSMGSGFQVKFGSYNNVLRNNVCNNVNSPCILLYDDWGLGSNLVEGNLVLNNVADSGIQVSAGAVIRNNIVINASISGIYVPSNSVNLYNGLGNRNLQIYHNTLVNNGKHGLEFQVTPTNTIVYNNAILGNTQDDFRSTSMSGVTMYRNAYNTGSEPPNTNANGTLLVGATSTVLINAAAKNVYPKSGSALVMAGYQGDLAYDFNYFERTGCIAPTIGAYEFSSDSNPGWSLSAAAKVIAGTVLPCTVLSPCPTSCAPSPAPAPFVAAPTPAPSAGPVAPTPSAPTPSAPTPSAPTPAPSAGPVAPTPIPVPSSSPVAPSAGPVPVPVPEAGPVAAPFLTPSSPGSNPVAPSSNPVAPSSNPVAPSSNPVAPSSNPVAPSSNPVAPSAGPVPVPVPQTVPVAPPSPSVDELSDEMNNPETQTSVSDGISSLNPPGAAAFEPPTANGNVVDWPISITYSRQLTDDEIAAHTAEIEAIVAQTLGVDPAKVHVVLRFIAETKRGVQTATYEALATVSGAVQMVASALLSLVFLALFI